MVATLSDPTLVDSVCKFGFTVVTFIATDFDFDGVFFITVLFSALPRRIDIFFVEAFCCSVFVAGDTWITGDCLARILIPGFLEVDLTAASFAAFLVDLAKILDFTGSDCVAMRVFLTKVLLG
jgi:hypothetical protein